MKTTVKSDESNHTSINGTIALEFLKNTKWWSKSYVFFISRKPIFYLIYNSKEVNTTMVELRDDWAEQVLMTKIR